MVSVVACQPQNPESAISLPRSNPRASPISRAHTIRAHTIRAFWTYRSISSVTGSSRPRVSLFVVLMRQPQHLYPGFSEQ